MGRAGFTYRFALPVMAVLLPVWAPRATADAAWIELAPLPFPVSNNAVTSVDNGDGTWTVFSFMGIRTPTNPQTITSASYKLTIPGTGWEPIADAPLLNGRAKIGANAVAVAGEVYLLGGYTAVGGEVTEPRLFRYDPAGDAYVQLADVPREVDDTVTGVYQDRYIYLVSGWHGPINSNVSNVQIYDTQTGAWIQATPIPAPLPGLFGHAGTVIGNRIVYMDGARIGPQFPISARMFVGIIDPLGAGEIATIAWTEVAAHPGSPAYRAAGSQGGTLDGRMLLVGGTDNTYNISGIGYNGVPSQPLDQVIAFDPLTDERSELTALGQHAATMDHRGLVRIGECWATVGGMTAPTVATARAFLLRANGSSLAGDFNCDSRVDLIDVAAFGACMTGPNGGPVALGCGISDLDGDGDADFADFAVLQRLYSLP